MFYWALIFFVAAVAAGVLGFTGITGAAVNVAWVVFIAGVALAIVLFFVGRKPSPSKTPS